MITQSQFDLLLLELRNISHGGNSEPLGFEALVMAIGGKRPPGDVPLVDALNNIASSINAVADAINTLPRPTPRPHYDRDDES